MTVLREGDLELQTPPEVSARRFDDAAHGLSHCMKAVDFIIEYGNVVLFVEVKDPDHPDAQLADRVSFVDRFMSGKIDWNLVKKCRDSFLYEWAADRLRNPVHFLVLVAIDSLDPAMLLSRSDSLKKLLPVEGPPGGVWSRRIAEKCLVLNIAEWNRHLPDLQVTRVAR